MNADEIVLEPVSVAAAPVSPSPQKVDPGLAEVEKNWNEFGKRDPLWAILTADSKRNNQWDLAEFFATGEREIDGVAKQFDSLNLVFGRGKALDFGCGVGRLTQALCRHFEECHGIDIAESMVEQARQYNRHGVRCHYHINRQPDLTIFGNDTFDFVYTNIVLQHNPPAMARKFIQEFLRILKPGGLLEFQLPSEPLEQFSGEGSPMKDGAFRAQLSLADGGSQWLAGTNKKISVTIKNTSSTMWPGKAVSGKFAIRLGNHWRDAKNRMVINDDARADLPHDLKPGEEILLNLSVTVPGVPGAYRLELDMVQEAVAWFADKKSPTLMLDVQVVSNQQAKSQTKPDAFGELNEWFNGKPPVKTATAAPSQVLVPRMDMNGIPKSEMLTFLAANGGKVLKVADDTGATGWLGYRYYVTKGNAVQHTAAPAVKSPAAVSPANVIVKKNIPAPTGSFQFAEDLLLSLRGRRVAIVGNATPTRNYGEIIDAYDVVIRLNNFRLAGFEKLVGTKTSYRCTSGWSDIEHRNEHIEFSPFAAATAESTNLDAFNLANQRPVLPACFDVHPLIAETPKPSTGLALIQLCSYLEIPVDLFAFDGFKSAHYWEKDTGFHTTHSRSEMDFILHRPGVLLFGETYPYQALYDFCHQQHHDYDENVGLELVRRLNKQFHGLRIIEFGSGNGELARHLEKQSNQVTAVEASRHAFERIPCAQKIHGTALDLPFVKQTFDLFMSVDVLEHLTENDCKIVIREAARLCSRVFVSVCTRPSGLLGPKGENLHLTVRPASWWAKEFSRYFDVQTYAGYGNGQLVIEGDRKADAAPCVLTSSEAQPATTKNDGPIASEHNDEFYVNLFIKDPTWSTPHPNEDEAARWEKISSFIKTFAARQSVGKVLRILDVGCGRGWLTQMASAFGDCEGVEPVAPVIEQARKLFPGRRFTAGTTDTILAASDFQPYDLVLTSEVIEHVPRDAQPAFVQKLSRLLKPGGMIILTTPRGEALGEWTRLAGDPSQPVEDWLCEPELCRLFVNEKFIVAGHENVLFNTVTCQYLLKETIGQASLLPIYQVWAFRKPANPLPSIISNAALNTGTASGYSFCIITNGKRPLKLAEEIASIRALQIPHFEILVGGDVPAGLDDVKIIPMPEAAQAGRLGEMRNRLIEAARYDHLVVADDDLVFKADFYDGLLQYGEDYEVLCVRFLNLDGTRYWDWATVSGPRGHSLLDYHETDPNVYVTGGLCVMKASVAARVQWDGQRGFYQSEDVDFSRRLHEAGISIKFNSLSTVVHTDARYTQVGTVIMTPDTIREAIIARVNGGKLENARTLLERLRTLDSARASAVEQEVYPALTQNTQTALTLPVRWRGPIFNPSGYASEAINFLLPLSECVSELGIFHQNNNYSEKFVAGLKAGERGCLFALRDRYEQIKGGIVIEHNPANGFSYVPDAVYRVGRTMFETDRISPAWVNACNQMDEIWVPSQFNVETFAASGVLRDKLIVMPESVNEDEFNPDRHTALPLPNRAKFNFLAIFEWSRRKGWDILLSAYLREFTAEDDVCLYLRTYLFNRPEGDPSAAIRRLIDEHAAKLGLGDKELPRIHIIAEQVAQADLPRLYKAADCLVAPSRGEGWGRPHHEAMMMGLPVIATNWSGNTEFMTRDNSYLIDYELTDTTQLDPELRHYQNQRWAEPSEKSLRQSMRQVQQHPILARAKGMRARREMLRQYSRGPVTRLLIARLQEIERKLVTPVCPAATARALELPAQPDEQKTRHLRVNWEGSFLDLGSLSHVNRELTEKLSAEKQIHLTRVSSQALSPEKAELVELKNLARRIEAQAPRQVDVTVRHAWPPNWQQPATGAWVLIQPWEFGVIPADWVKKLNVVDEIWAPTEYVRRVYVESGVHPSKVKIVPNGIDPEKFRPDVEPLKLATQKKFKFLFVGGTIARKGPDILLNAFLKTFTAADDVCLVIKDFGGQSVYQGQTLEKQITDAQLKPDAPEILYLTQELSPEDMPRLYASCQCLLHPYRGEGFGLPVLEAMACGLPVVVTGGGATDDFATDDFAFRLPALKKSIGETVAGMKLQHNGWWLEPQAEVLTERMRWIVANAATAHTMGHAASDYVRREWTWQRAAQIVSQRLQEVAAKKQAGIAALAQRRARKAAAIELPAVARVGQLQDAQQLLVRKDFLGSWNSALAAIAVRPFHCEAYLLLAETARAAGDSAQARTCAEYALKLTPNWKPAKQFLKNIASGVGTLDWPELPAPHRTPRLTVCLIARNEEKFLAQCLASIRDLAHQIIVVDTGSTDATVEIARGFNAEVYHFPWNDDFSAARNEALKHATGDWILALDADEEFLPEHRQTLLQEIQAAPVMAYRLPIIDIGREQEGASYVPRLFRNAPGLFYVGRVHEQVFTSIEVRCRQWDMQNCHGKSALRHHGYVKEVVVSRDKIARNLRLLELAIEELPNEPNLLMNYGLELVRSGQLEAGLEQSLEALHLMSRLPANEVVPELRETLFTQISTHLLAGKCYNEVVQIWQTPFARSAGLTASQHFTLGLAHLELQQPAEVAEQMRQCLAKRHRPTLTPINREILKAGPNHCLALALVSLKDMKGAEAAFRAALVDDPTSRNARFDFARFHAQQGQFIEALTLLNALAAENTSDAQVWEFGGQIALSQPQFLDFAQNWTTEAVKYFPAHPAISLQHAETLLLSQQAADAIRWWSDDANASARQIAALTLCEFVGGPARRHFADNHEKAVSQEFLNWYRKLIKYNATSLITQINENLDSLQPILPSAVNALTTILKRVPQSAA